MVSAYPILAHELKVCNITDTMLAERLNIPEKTLSLKMKGLLPWKLSEAIEICVVLKNSDIPFLFSN